MRRRRIVEHTSPQKIRTPLFLQLESIAERKKWKRREEGGKKDGTGDILPGSEWVPGVEDL